jgi:Transposase, Mutator family
MTRRSALKSWIGAAACLAPRRVLKAYSSVPDRPPSPQDHYPPDRTGLTAETLEEAGEGLFTFLRFPKLQWKALRTTNAVERINEEFRRRTTTQASLPSQDAVLLLLFGLMRSGQIRLRRLDGWQDLPAVKEAA